MYAIDDYKFMKKKEVKKEMAIHVFDTKRRAKSYCAKKNKYAREYSYNYQKSPKGGYYVYKYHNRSAR